MIVDIKLLYPSVLYQEKLDALSIKLEQEQDDQFLWKIYLK